MGGMPGNSDHIQRLRDAEILIECQSPWNTLLLPVKKSGGSDYHPIQDLHTINSAVITIRPVIPNPYTLLSLLPTQASWFTCLNLKDTFFCPQLSLASQPLFTFECKDPHTGRKTQLTWTQLPQGFKNSSTLFGEALSAHLGAFPGETFNCTLFQYMDDLLLPIVHPMGLLERHHSPVGSTLHHRVQGVMEKGSALQTGGQIDRKSVV